MGLVGLHQYLDRIEELLEARQVEEANAHCHHILNQEPRHLETHRLMGRILLELQNYEEALKVFVQVLRADPEDLIAHAGRGLAYKEEGDYAKAIWHMERAAEIDAYNSSIQMELANLYNVAGSGKSEKRDLSLAAMARLHIVSGRYNQAERELQEVIERSPDRYDLRALLAESLFLDNRIEDAAKSSSKILKVLPECIKPNSILGMAYIQHDEKRSAHRIASKLAPLLRPDKVTLDKESLYGKFLLSLDPKAIPERIMVKELEQPSNGSRAGKSGKNEGLSRQQSAAKAGIPTWIAAEKGEAGGANSHIDNIDEIDDVMLWLKAIAAEEGPLFDSESDQATDDSDKQNQVNENSSSLNYSPEAKVGQGRKSEVSSDGDTNMLSSLTVATESAEKKKDDLISAVDYEEALPPWLNEVISFTDNLSVNETEVNEDNIRDKQAALEAAVAGGIMASLLFDSDDSHSLAHPEDKIMNERNEPEQEKPDDAANFSTDDEWLEELSRKTNEELESAQSGLEADVDELGEIGPGEEIPDWLAADLESVEEAETNSTDPSAQSGTDVPLEASQDAEDGQEASTPDSIPQATTHAQEDDLDWLDHLADEDLQPAEVQEPQVAADSASYDMDALASEIPEDPDEAIAWLEQLAEGENDSGGILEGIPSDDTGTPAADQAAPLTMPADENEAAAWLEEVVATSLAKAPEDQASEMTVIAEAVTPQAPMDVAIAKAEAERIMSEDPEMSSGESIESSLFDESVQPAAGEDQIIDWLDDLDVAADQVQVEGEPALEDESVSESTAVDEGDSPQKDEEFDWLETIDLEETAEPVEDLTEVDPAEDTIEETVIAQAPEIIDESPAPLDQEEYESDEEDVEAAGEDDVNLFSLAKTALSDGNIDEAVVNYKVILASKENLPDLIAALESAVDQHESQPALKRLLGDAYTENGQLQKALEMYRKALEDI